MATVLTDETIAAETVGDYLEPTKYTVASPLVTIAVKVVAADALDGGAILVSSIANPFDDAVGSARPNSEQDGHVRVDLPAGFTGTRTVVSKLTLLRALDQILFLSVPTDLGEDVDVSVEVSELG